MSKRYSGKSKFDRAIKKAKLSFKEKRNLKERKRKNNYVW